MEAMLNQVLLMLLFCAVGYVLCRTGVVKESHAQVLSTLTVYVFLPCSMFKSFALEMTPDKLSQNMSLLLIGVGSGVATILLGILNGRLLSKDSYERHMFCYTTVVSNNGYVGTPLVGAVYGDALLLRYLVFAFPINFYTYLVAFPQLTRQKTSWKMFLKPVILSMVLGALVGLLRIPVPVFFRNVLQSAANCTGPISMLLTGIVISQFPFKELLMNRRAWIMTALRLVVLPVCLTLVMKVLFGSEIALVAFLFYAMPCGLNTVVFPKSVGENCMTGASMAMISTVLCALTIPLELALLFG